MTWSHYLKLYRANEHLDALRKQFEQWDAEGYELTTEAASPNHYSVKARITGRTFGEEAWPLLIGDFLQNARAALDYVAYALGDAGASGYMDEPTARNNAFPIVGDVDKHGYSGRGADLFEEAAKRNLATVDPHALEVIRRLQPYYVGGSTWNAEYLWILHELARYDRHRFFQLTVVTTGSLEVNPEKTRNVRIADMEVESGTFFPEWDEESGHVLPTTIATFTAHPAKADRPMELHFRNALEIGFDIDTVPESVVQWLDGASVELTLSQIGSYVDRALSALRRFLPAQPPP